MAACLQGLLEAPLSLLPPHCLLRPEKPNQVTRGSSEEGQTHRLLSLMQATGVTVMVGQGLERRESQVGDRGE